jgi:hypothetical protein
VFTDGGKLLCFLEDCAGCVRTLEGVNGLFSLMILVTVRCIVKDAKDKTVVFHFFKRRVKGHFISE